jgi:hypothetical protein
MRRILILIAGGLLLVPGCSTMTPEARLRNELFWEAAKECETRYRTLHLDNIDTGGGISMHADAETRSELEQFRRCYRQGVKDRVERRRQAGLPVPDELNEEPTAEID